MDLIQMSPVFSQMFFFYFKIQPRSPHFILFLCLHHLFQFLTVLLIFSCLSLILLKCTTHVFCGVSLDLGFVQCFLIIRLRLWTFGKNVREELWPSNCIGSYRMSVCLIPGDVQPDLWLWWFLLCFSTVKLLFLPLWLINILGKILRRLCVYPVSPQTFAHWFNIH